MASRCLSTRVAVVAGRERCFRIPVSFPSVGVAVLAGCNPAYELDQLSKAGANHGYFSDRKFLPATGHHFAKHGYTLGEPLPAFVAGNPGGFCPHQENTATLLDASLRINEFPANEHDASKNDNPC